MTGRDSYEVAVGDAVKYWIGIKRAYDGTVVKVGPKRVHVDDGHGWIVQYFREDRQRCDGRPGHFATLAQVADGETREAALQEMREHGLEIGWHRVTGWTTPQIVALAEAVATIRTSGTEPR